MAKTHSHNNNAPGRHTNIPGVSTNGPATPNGPLAKASRIAAGLKNGFINYYAGRSKFGRFFRAKSLLGKIVMWPLLALTIVMTIRSTNLLNESDSKKHVRLSNKFERSAHKSFENKGYNIVDGEISVHSGRDGVFSLQKDGDTSSFRYVGFYDENLGMTGKDVEIVDTSKAAAFQKKNFLSLKNSAVAKNEAHAQAEKDAKKRGYKDIELDGWQATDMRGGVKLTYKFNVKGVAYKADYVKPPALNTNKLVSGFQNIRKQ